MKTLLFLLLMCTVLSLDAVGQSQFRAGERVIIDKDIQDDFYAAGGEIELRTSVKGDLVVAGGELNIMGLVYDDLIAAGGEIRVDGFVTDDLRIAGGDINISGTIGDDLIIFGGDILIDKGAEIGGNLIVFGGNVEIGGVVKGDVKARAGVVEFTGMVENDFEMFAGQLDMNGVIGGRSTIVCDQIDFGGEASFGDDIEYWTDEGQVDFSAYQTSGKAVFNEGLAPEGGFLDFKKLGLAAFFMFLAYLVAVFLLLLIANGFLKKYFAQSAGKLDQQFVKCFGLGVLYLIGLPVAIFLLIMMVVTIPIAIPLAMVYGLTIFYGHVVGGLLLSHFIRNKYYPSWPDGKVLWAALGIVVILRILSFIPFLGWVISMVVIASSVGAFIIDYRERRTPAVSA